MSVMVGIRAQMNLQRLVRVGVVLGTLGLVVWSAADSVRIALADRAAQPARRALAAWRVPGQQPLDVASWTMARDALERARMFAPDDPDLALDLGLVLLLRARHSAHVPPLAGALLDDALVAFRDAARLRPVWAQAWAYIAHSQRLRLRLGVVTPAEREAGTANGEAERSAVLARRYGPYEPVVRRLLEPGRPQDRHAEGGRG